MGGILINVCTGPTWEGQAQLAELERLSSTADIQVLDRFVQRRKQIDGKYVIGKGKLEQILVRAMQLNAEILIFDNELSPSQLRNISLATELSSSTEPSDSRYFAQRATTKKESFRPIAQLRYRKPRIKIMPTAMSRLTGGLVVEDPGNQTRSIVDAQMSVSIDWKNSTKYRKDENSDAQKNVPTFHRSPSSAIPMPVSLPFSTA